MATLNIGGRAARRALVACALAAGVAMAPQMAFAGECPADKVAPDATKANTTPAKEVTDTVLAATDLAKEPAHVAGRQLRLRKLVVQAGGVVPWHSHGDRPAIIYILDGEIAEYASNCAVPIVHKTGDVARETSVTSHWWKNTGAKAAVLLSADFFPDKADDHMM